MTIKRDSKGRFIKGNMSGNQFKKGSSGFIGKHTEESKKKMGGKRPNYIPWNKGLTKKDNKRIKGGRKSKGAFLANGYLKRFINGKHILVSHMVWSKNNGIPVPKNCCVHHIDMNKLNNNISNLVLLPNDFHIKAHWEYEKNNSINRFNKEVKV